MTCSAYRSALARTTATRGLVVALLALSACASSGAPGDAPQGAQAQHARPSSADRLYGAIVAEAQARGWQAQTASERYWLYETTPELLNPRFRKVRLMRVIVLPRGGALRVQVRYERDVGSADAPRWVPVQDALTKERAAQEEVALGRAIERRFHEAP